MAEKRRRYIFGSFVLNGLSVVLVIVSIVTDNWVETDMQAEGDSEVSSLNYGLYGGEMTLRVLVIPSFHDLHMVCVASVGSCVITCKTTPDARRQEVINLAEGSRPATLVCDDNSNVNQQQPDLGREPVISYALFISLNVFMYLQLIFGISATVLAIMNVMKNPTEPILGLPGVELSSGLSALAGTITLMIWGIYFAVDLKNHLAFAYIAAQPLSYNAALGYSYWLLLPAAVFSMCGLGMIELRRYLLERDPPAPTIQIENHSDGTIFLY